MSTQYFYSMQEYKKAWQARASELRKASTKSAFAAASFMEAQAKAMAPVYTGETIKGIKHKKKGTGYIVESTVPGRFKQNMWANQTAPFRQPRMVWNGRKPTLYGQSHRTSGTPGFFRKAAYLTSKRFKQLARQNTLKALRVKA